MLGVLFCSNPHRHEQVTGCLGLSVSFRVAGSCREPEPWPALSWLNILSDLVLMPGCNRLRLVLVQFVDSQEFLVGPPHSSQQATLGCGPGPQQVRSDSFLLLWGNYWLFCFPRLLSRAPEHHCPSPLCFILSLIELKTMYLCSFHTRAHTHTRARPRTHTHPADLIHIC